MKRSEQEEVILSTLIRSSGFMDLAALFGLMPEHFTTPAHVYIFGAVLYLRRREYPVSPTEIARVLRRRKQLKPTVSDALKRLEDGQSAAADIEAFVRYVKSVRGRE